MPTGSDLPHFTFTDGGSQSVRTAIDNTENAISAFLTSEQKRFLSGSNTVVIEESVKGSADNTQINNLVDSVTFRLPDDCDAISDVLFHYDFVIKTDAIDTKLSYTLGLELINKIEVRVGNHVWQTLTGADIFARMGTENSIRHSDWQNSITTVRAPGKLSADSSFVKVVNINNNKHVSGNLDLKLFMGAGIRLNSFIQAGAPNNQIDVRIYFNKIDERSLDSDSITGSENFTASLIVTKHKFTALERDYVRNNIINSVVNTSQNKTQYLSTLGTSVPTDQHSEVSFSINVNDFNLNTSHILVSIQNSSYGESPTTPQTNLETSIYGPVPFGPLDSTKRNGIFDCLSHLEFFANGNSVTGKLPASICSSSIKCRMGLSDVGNFPVYTIPLCSFAFGEDAPSLARLNNKKVVLYTTGFLLGGTTLDNIKANITAVGTNIVTYVGGQCNQQLSN